MADEWNAALADEATLKKDRKERKKLEEDGYRSHLDLRNEKIGFKIREHTLHKVPYLLVVGDKEVETDTVAVRTRKGEDLGVMSIDAFVEILNDSIAQRGRFGMEN